MFKDFNDLIVFYYRNLNLKQFIILKWFIEYIVHYCEKWYETKNKNSGYLKCIWIYGILDMIQILFYVTFCINDRRRFLFSFTVIINTRYVYSNILTLSASSYSNQQISQFLGYISKP